MPHAHRIATGPPVQPATLAAEDQGAAREAGAWAALAPAWTPAAVRGALHWAVLESVPCHPSPLAGWAPNLQPDRSPFVDWAIASHSDATNNIVRRASRSFMPSGLLLIKLSPPDFAFVHDDAPGTCYKRLAALEVPEGAENLTSEPVLRVEPLSLLAVPVCPRSALG